MKQRIWELDAFRGICILGVIIIHALFDMTELYGILSWNPPVWFQNLQQWGGVLFILLSGICATLGRHNVRRGAIVFGCGMVITLVTWAMYALGLEGKWIIIYFGVLHCLGVCMMLWHFFKKLPAWALIAAGLPMAILGLWAMGQRFDVPAVMAVFGFARADFTSSDYFPLLPHFGFFLIGGALGKLFYHEKKSLMPGVSAQNPVVKFFTFCGRQSLWIYLAHQPILSLIFWILA